VLTEAQRDVAVRNTEERVDVLDAFRLARWLRDERADLLAAGWDVDADGAVDERDVDRLLDLAVSLEGV
jgi:hypothetical protein